MAVGWLLVCLGYTCHDEAGQVRPVRMWVGRMATSHCDPLHGYLLSNPFLARGPCREVSHVPLHNSVIEALRDMGAARPAAEEAVAQARASGCNA